MRFILADKLSFLASSIIMIIAHGSTGHWNADLAAGLTAGSLAVGAAIRAVIRSDERSSREHFLRQERQNGEYTRLTAAEKSLITAMRDDERKELR